MKVLMYPHAGSGNHGCEAIVRSTIKLTGADAILCSSSPEEDKVYGLDSICDLRHEREPIRRSSVAFASAWLKYHALRDRDALDRLAFSPLLKASKECGVALSMGGDNYCYGDSEILYLINRELRRRGLKTVLWGCSLEPDSLKGALLEDIRGYDRIVARESLTYNALQASGLRNVELYPDPAFALERKEAAVPPGFVEGNTVGVNVSPLMIGRERRKGLVLESFIRLIDGILRDSDMTVALIPHVVRYHDDDRGPLNSLHDRYKDSGRVILVDDAPAEGLKDIIARCRFIVGCRTHACIAAYSSMVPVLTLGYSVKASGIAHDVMPAGREFVLPVAGLDSPDTLAGAFSDLVGSESVIRDHLESFIPDYVGKLDGLELKL